MRMLAQAEADFNIHLYSNRHSTLRGWLEAPLPHGFNRALIQSLAERSLNFDISGNAVGADDHPKNHITAYLRSTCFLCVFRFNVADQLWSSHITTDFENLLFVRNRL